ncbi:MAG: TolC family outer membrane protein [Alphaproteobacteria bacterium]
MGIVAIGDHAFAQSLSSEVGTLLVNHPRLGVGQKTVSAAQEGERRSFGAFLPRITLDGDTGYERVDSPSRRRIEGEPSSMGRNSAALTVTQNVFDGFRRSSSYDGAKINTQVQEASLEATRQALIFEGTAAYLDVLRNVQLVDLARNNENTIQRQLNLEDERVARGAGMAVDALLAKSRLQLAKERRVAFEGLQRDSSYRYLQVFGRQPTPDSMADPLAPINLVPGSLDEAVRIAMGTNPSINGSNRQIDLAQTRRTTAGSDYFPRLDVVGRTGYEKNVDGVTGDRRDISVLLRATWELFSGFSTRAAVAEAAFQYEAAKDNLQVTNRKVAEETRLAWNELSVARERVQLLQNAVNIAGEVFDARDRLRAAGRDTAINVLDAENELYNARINFVQAAYDARKAIYRLTLAMGMLTPENIDAQR